MEDSAMKREDQRRENARALAAAIGGLAEFGRKMGMENSQVSQIIGKTPTKNIGNGIAGRIETAFNLAPGALDEPMADSPPPVALAAPAMPMASALHAQCETAMEQRILTAYRIADQDGRDAIESAADAALEHFQLTIRNKG